MKSFNRLLLATSSVALTAAGVAHAQLGSEDTLRQQTVTVTGSAIAGTPEDAALPVDVLTAADLKLEGSPSVTELIRNLGVSSGVDGQTNQFASNGLEGTSNVNLRGLGPARTLVLINGRRQVFSPPAIGEQAQLFVDTNMIPSAAISRIEVLKDGAAAIYGSDAIAGVVNFITRDDFEGFELGGSFETFEGSDGNYTASAAYGLQGDNWNWVTSAGYQLRSEVGLLEKDWGTPTLGENPVAGFSSLSNPGRFLTIGALPGGGFGVNGNVVDVGCVPLGGQLAGDGTCRFQFTQFDNLVEKEERFQIFSEYNRDMSIGDFHLEVLYGQSDVPEWKTSPSYPPQALTNQVVFPSHPGWQQYIADNPGTALDTALQALFIGRVYGWGGFPGTGGAQEGFRKHKTWRVASSLQGEWDNGVTYDFGLGYSTSELDSKTNDTYIVGLTAALRGFGVCTNPIDGTDPATGTQPFAAGYAGSLAPGVGGCEYYNPFSNAIPAGAINGNANPQYNPALANSLTLADWMTDGGVEGTTTNELTVFDAVFSGQSGVQAAGGTIGWAAGFQMRHEARQGEPTPLTNLNITPGPGGTGAFSFLAGTVPTDRDQTIYAVFGEVQIPLFENLDIQLATRYEDYGGDVGSTFDPKVAAKWQVTDSLALRGSAQTSFKGPTLNQLGGVGTTLQFVAPTAAFKAVDQFGNAGLAPESAFSFNFGALFDHGNFSASLDYYNFDFSDPIIVEEQTQIVAAAVAALQAGDLSAPILNRITFNDPNNIATGAAGGTDISRIRVNVVNGPDIKTSGIDFRMENVWDNFGNGAELTIGADSTYVIEYDVDPYFVEGVSIGGGDYAGQFNRSNFNRSMPQFKANVFANYAIGPHNLRGVMRYINSYDDERPAASRGNVYPTIDSQTTFDGYYTYASDSLGLNLGLSVVNIFDEDPPAAAFDLNYDPYTHNPFGRTFKVSLTKQFGGN